MPVALPAGWLDTQKSYSYTFTLKVSMRACSTYGSLIVEGFRLYTQGSGVPLACGGGTFGQEINDSSIFGGDTIAYSTAELWLDRPAGADVMLQSVPGLCAPDWFSDVLCTKTIGPFREGVTIEVDDSGVRTLRHCLFGDADTVETTTVGGYTSTSSPYATPTPVPTGPRLIFGFDPYSAQQLMETTEYAFRWREPTAQGAAIDVTGITGAFVATDSQTVQAKQWRTAPGGVTRHGFGAPYVWKVDAQVVTAGGVETGATLAPNFPAAAFYTSPAAATETHRNASWLGDGFDGTLTMRVADAWANAQSPVVPTAERAVPLRNYRPKAPEATPTSWSPVTFQFAGSLNVLRSANAWVPAGAATVSGAGGSTWSVTGAGASVTRTLLEKWRNWTTAADPLFNAQGFKVTRHDYYGTSPQQDVWGWGSYAFLDVDITAPAPGTLTLTVSGVYAAFTYATGVLSGTTAKVATYSVPVTAGRQTVRVDLLFPATWSDATAPATSGTGGPYYHDRVDAVKFEGLATGSYTLHSLTLKAMQPGFLKIDYGRQMTGITYAQDGAFVTGLWGQNPQHPPITGPFFKDDEGYRGPADQRWGGGVPAMEYVGTSTLSQRTIAQMWEDLNRIEGVTAAYDGTAMEADLTDAYAATIGIDYESQLALAEPRRSQWLHRQVPHLRTTPDTLYTLAASVLADRLRIAPGVGTAGAPVYTLYARGVLGGVLEALCRKSAGTRAAAGATIKAVRTDTGAEVARGLTDTCGYVVIAVGADSTRTYRLEEV